VIHRLPEFYPSSLPSKSCWSLAYARNLSESIHLATDRPLSEPKWVKSRDVQKWLKSVFGRMFWVAKDAADRWKGRSKWTLTLWVTLFFTSRPIAHTWFMLGPESPTIWTILESWSVNSPVGTQTERRRLLKMNISSEPDNILWILLWLVRERAPLSPAPCPMYTLIRFGPLVKASVYCVSMRGLTFVASHTRTVAPNGFKIWIQAYVHAPLPSPTRMPNPLKAETLPEGDVGSIKIIRKTSL
jgi:hypothetical protein